MTAQNGVSEKFNLSDPFKNFVFYVILIISYLQAFSILQH